MSPYILKIERPDLDPIVEEMGQRIDSPGKFVYVNFKWFRKYVPGNFFNFALYVGAIILLVFELYRRVIAPHEDERIESELHGDVK